MNDIKKANTSNNNANNAKIKKVQLVKLQALYILICFSMLHIKKLWLLHHNAYHATNLSISCVSCDWLIYLDIYLSVMYHMISQFIYELCIMQSINLHIYVRNLIMKSLYSSLSMLNSIKKLKNSNKDL